MRVLTKYGVNDADEFTSAKNYVELACDSTETKPTQMIADGSIALETDTGKVYVFNEKSSAWIEYRTVKEG